MPRDVENPGGALVVLRGSATGLVATDAQLFTVASFSTPSSPQPDNALGFALAAGLLGPGGTHDLVIGASTPAGVGPGILCVLYGSPQGLSASGATCFSGGSGEIAAGNGGEGFAEAFAIGELAPAIGRELVVGNPRGREVFVMRNALFTDGFEFSASDRWLTRD